VRADSGKKASILSENSRLVQQKIGKIEDRKGGSVGKRRAPVEPHAARDWFCPGRKARAIANKGLSPAGEEKCQYTSVEKWGEDGHESRRRSSDVIGAGGGGAVRPEHCQPDAAIVAVKRNVEGGQDDERNDQ